MIPTPEQLDKAFTKIREDTSIDTEILNYIETATRKHSSMHTGYINHMTEKHRKHEYLMNQCNNEWICIRELYEYQHRQTKDKTQTVGLNTAYKIATKNST